MSRVNPDVLRWARQTAGLTTDAAAQRIGMLAARGLTPGERIEILETGDAEPTDAQLRKIADAYRRPLLTFYLDAPPAPDRGTQDFRALPRRQPLQEARVAALLRDVRARQATVRDLMEDDDAKPLDLVGSGSPEATPATLARRIVEALGFDLIEFRRRRGALAAFEYLRGCVERAGLYVLLIGDLGHHSTAVTTEAFRGFAIADPIAPFVVINSNDARPAWSFTLLHEVAHVFLGVTASSSARDEAGIERFCDDVAGACLLPEDDLAGIALDREAPLTAMAREIGALAERLNLSRTLVALRLRRAGVIGEVRADELRRLFRAQWVEAEERRRLARQGGAGGPSYYVVRRQRLGRALLAFVDRMVRAGSLSPVKAARVLGVKPSGVEPLLRRRA